jgi:hypothetical protein
MMPASPIHQIKFNQLSKKKGGGGGSIHTSQEMKPSLKDLKVLLEILFEVRSEHSLQKTDRHIPDVSV